MLIKVLLNFLNTIQSIKNSKLTTFHRIIRNQIIKVGINLLNFVNKRIAQKLSSNKEKKKKKRKEFKNDKKNKKNKKSRNKQSTNY